MTSFPVVFTFAVVYMASGENSLVPERSQAYIVKKHGFKVSKIMGLLNKLKKWVMKWSYRSETGEFSEGVFTGSHFNNSLSAEDRN